MMLMPAGPPALVIQGLAELAKASEATKMAIAKTLTVCLLLAEERGCANSADHVHAFALHLVYYYGGVESLPGRIRG